MSKSSGTISAEETKQMESNENCVSQGVEQISGGEIQELNVLSPEYGTSMERKFLNYTKCEIFPLISYHSWLVKCVVC